MQRPDVALPGVVLGVGLGGFVDGIVLHQVLQWHHLLSSRVRVDTVPGLKMNTLADGLFHVVTWLAVLIGLSLLYSRVTQARGRLWGSRALWGWVVLGWGLFNLVEGLLDHRLLGIHHVRSGVHQTAWDVGFLALGAALVAVGWLVQRGAEPGRRAAATGLTCTTRGRRRRTSARCCRSPSCWC
ncbi:hypothetical protein GCM10025868_29350 [Angustibacter aerolatus]|uniref:DUF2243 domain-containing protein n=1 Tax=Angustibacter aerolatus TaxID=1162965 RepID=A0ABQ6JLM6_9ACTN|nr:hypothetical protein GCM10025868_29350 [Angustibacter aerolatus]